MAENFMNNNNKNMTPGQSGQSMVNSNPYANHAPYNDRDYNQREAYDNRPYDSGHDFNHMERMDGDRDAWMDEWKKERERGTFLHKENKMSRGTMDEDMKKFYHEMMEDFPDEINDANKYLDFARMAKKHGDEEIAEGLIEIAKDEYTHAHFIREILIDEGLEMKPGVNEAFEMLKKRVERIFR